MKNGITANGKQRFRCKDCRRQFITRDTYRAYRSEVRRLVVPMTMNGSGIRDISRVLAISTNTVLSILRAAATATTEPCVPKQISDLEADEFWSFVEKKKNQRWTWSAFDRPRKKLVAFVNGRRTDNSCQRLLKKLLWLPR